MEGALQAEQLGLAIDFDLVNQQVLDYTNFYTNEWWGALSSSTRQGMRTAIAEHITSGAELGVLEKKLTPLFGKARARVISATETTRMFAEGNRIAYRSAGVGQVQFQTVRDSRVDPVCDALQGQLLPIDDQENFPPLHARCRCWIAPVTDEGEVLKDPAAGGRIVSPLEDQISKSAIGNPRGLGGGINETSVAHVQGDGDVVLKPRSGLMDGTLRTGIRPGGDLAREVSAFRVDQHLGGLGRVPETIMRADTPAGEAMVQSFVKGTQTLSTSSRRIHTLANLDDFQLYDAVIGNLDRHAGNVLVNPAGEAVMIDHGLAFPERVAIHLHDGNMVFMRTIVEKELSTAHRSLLRNFGANRKAITEELAGLGLEDDAIVAMWDRVDWMIAEGRYMNIVDWERLTAAY